MPACLWKPVAQLLKTLTKPCSDMPQKLKLNIHLALPTLTPWRIPTNFILNINLSPNITLPSSLPFAAHLYLKSGRQFNAINWVLRGPYPPFLFRNAIKDNQDHGRVSKEKVYMNIKRAWRLDYHLITLNRQQEPSSPTSKFYL